MSSRKVFSYQVRREVLDKSNGRCCHCGDFLRLEVRPTMTIEHIIPLSRGGTNSIDNLVALCKYCNRERGNKYIVLGEYYKYLPKKYRDIFKEEKGEVV